MKKSSAAEPKGEVAGLVHVIGTHSRKERIAWKPNQQPFPPHDFLRGAGRPDGSAFHFSFSARRIRPSFCNCARAYAAMRAAVFHFR